MERKPVGKLGKALAVVFALGLWQIAAMTVNSRILLVSPIDVAVRLTTIWQTEGFWSSIWFSFYHIAGGFFIALALGITLAALAGRFRWVETLLWPFLVTIKTVPVASFLIVLPVVYGNVLEGLKSEDKLMLEVGTVFKMPPLRKVLYIHLPQLKPFLMSACATALGRAWKAGVAAEIIGTPDGSIGKQLFYSKIYLDTDDLLCWTVIIVIISVLFEKLFMIGLRALYGRLERG